MSTLARLRRMSWEEIRVRLGQEISKRSDLAYSRMGLATAPGTLGSKDGIVGKFFFSPNELPDRVRLLRETLPAEAEAVVREAEEICRHQFRLLGYPDLNYGVTIDWHLDAVSGKRAPLRPWFKIHFLHYDEVGDHKVIWELNRHQHLVVLAKAWCLTRKNKYLDEITSQWYSWQAANPYPLGINWASSLEVAFRSLSWLWLLALLADCPQIPEVLPSDVVSALTLSGRHIERYLSTYFSPNTHLLGEAVALFFIGTLFPQLAAASRWRKRGWQILLQEMDRQVRPDGLYFEQSLYYHVYALDFFLHSRILAARNEIAIPAAFDEKIEKMLDVLQSLAQTGAPEGFGDDDGGRVFNPRRNRTEHLTDPLAMGAALYPHRGGVTVTEEAIWLLGSQFTYETSSRPASSQLESRSFSDAGLYVMADENANMQLVIDAGPQGTGRCGHGHADAMSISVSGGGRRWLIDSGTGSYVATSEERATLRATAAHNTLRVDHLDQAVPDGPFAWNSIPRVKADRWIVGDSFNFFEGSHEGYMRLANPVTHRRFVFLLKGEFWLVRDLAEGSGIHDLEIFWHYAQDLTVRSETSAFIAEPRLGTEAAVGARKLILQTCANAGWTSGLDTSLISPAYGATCSAPVVRLNAHVPLPADFACLLMPDTNSHLGKLSPIELTGAAGVSGYRKESLDREHLFFFAETDRPWECGPWSSDARFLYCCLEEGRLTGLILVVGSFCKWNDAELVTLHRKIERFEWFQRNGRPTMSSSDNSAVPYAPDRELILIK